MFGSKSPVDVLIIDVYPTGAFKLCPFVVIGMTALCLHSNFKGDFTHCNSMLLLTVSGVIKKMSLPSV